MDENISKLLKELIPGLHIDVPIVAARIVGNRLELTLYGGEQRSIPLPAADDLDSPPPAPAKKITKKSKKRS